MTREEVFAWVREQYGTEPDYPWMDMNAVLRHKVNRKWYGVVMQVRRDRLGLTGEDLMDIINVKSDPMLIDTLRGREGFYPAYHMNKSQWISIGLHEKADGDEIKNLIALSYALTTPKKKRQAGKKGRMH